MISPEQRELRKRYIGSSDAAAVLGLDPYQSASDIWLQKTGRVDGFEGNEHTERGNLLEPVVLQWAKKKIGVHFSTDVMKIAPCKLLAANFDGIDGVDNPLCYAEPSLVVEAKTTIDPGEWGEENTDQVPERVIAQVHHQMFVAGPQVKQAYVPVLMPGFRSFDFKMYRVERKDDLANAIADRCRDFMRKYVQTDIRPDDFRPSLEILKRMRRTPNKSVPIDAKLVQSWQAAKDALKDWEGNKKDAEAAILAAMGDAEHATFDGGYLTYLEVHRRAYEVKESSYRQLRLKAAGGEQ